MSYIVNTFLLAGGTFMPEMHLGQTDTWTGTAWFTYSACLPFTKNQ